VYGVEKDRSELDAEVLIVEEERYVAARAKYSASLFQVPPPAG
jgi:hypothetical protein